MKRFTIKSTDSVKVYAMAGRKEIASRYDSFGTVAECIAWAKAEAEQRNATLTEIQIVNNTNDTCATYKPSCKRIF